MNSMTPQDHKLISKLIKDNNKVLALLMDVKFEQFQNEFEQKMHGWTSEIIDSVDVMAKEIVDERDFREITTHQIVENRERADRLEKKVFGAVVSA
jgi:hypothetical protein